MHLSLDGTAFIQLLFLICRGFLLHALTSSLLHGPPGLLSICHGHQSAFTDHSYILHTGSDFPKGSHLSGCHPGIHIHGAGHNGKHQHQDSCQYSSPLHGIHTAHAPPIFSPSHCRIHPDTFPFPACRGYSIYRNGSTSPAEALFLLQPLYRSGSIASGAYPLLFTIIVLLRTLVIKAVLITVIQPVCFFCLRPVCPMFPAIRLICHQANALFTAFCIRLFPFHLCKPSHDSILSSDWKLHIFYHGKHTFSTVSIERAVFLCFCRWISKLSY